ncbi:MAG: FAD-binding oxidoreductase [Acidobacteria bacterium]|nr:FAD-binding oxidoreductase [Acidobacteriota bacterium]
MSLLATSVEKLSHICGSQHVVSDSVQCEPYAVDGVVPTTVVEPDSPEQIGEIVRWARAERAALLPVGSGCLLGLGGIPERIDVALSLARLNSVLHHDPGDLTIGVGTGMSLERVQAALGQHNQFLPVNPPAAAEARIGGLLATNLSGPWRYAYGSWRDFVLGLRFVTGTGKLVRTGGRVVKNVAGYDLSKLLIGSLGTLGIIVDVNFKAFPRPEQRATWVAGFNNLTGTLALRSAIVHSPLPPLAIELIDESAAKLTRISETLPKARWWLLVEAGGPATVLSRYERELSQRAVQAGAREFAQLREADAQTLWAGICDSGRRARKASPGATVVKASLPLTQMESFLTQAGEIANRHHLPTATCARAGSGIIYFALLAESADKENVERVRQAATEMMQQGTSLGGRVTLEWAPTAVKRLVNVWGATRDDSNLMQKLKAEFDPDRVLNPGRFLGGL